MRVVHVPTQILPLIQVDAETHFDPLVPKSYVVPAKSNVHATSCSDAVEQRRTAALQQRLQILARIEEDREERRSKRNSVSVACVPITESQTEQQQQQQEQEKDIVGDEDEEHVVVISSSSRESSPQLITARGEPQDTDRRRSVRLSSRGTARMQCSNKAAPAKAAPAKAAPAKKEESSSDSDSDSSSSDSSPSVSCAPKKATKKGCESSSSGSSSGSGSSSSSSDSSDSPSGFVSTLSVPRRGFILGTSFDARTVEDAKSWLLTNFARAHGGHVFCRNSWWESLDVCFIRLTLNLQH
jgi:hypothetical protein